MEIEADHVETQGWTALYAAKVIAGSGAEQVALGTVDGSFRRDDTVAAAGLNFHETEHIGIPADQVDLTSAARGPKVARDDDVALLAEIEVCRVFAATSHLQMTGELRARVRTCGAGEGISGTKSESGEAALHAGMITGRLELRCDVATADLDGRELLRHKAA